ncbi:MAG: hypothetical protein VST68_06315, partial [Nitrospirota bacterium]|nr:hypothetical protein [Nitrospirota bacterium]
MFRFKSIKHKILVLFSLLIFFILLAILIAISEIYESRMRTDIENRLKQTHLIVQRILSERNQQLSTSA